LSTRPRSASSGVKAAGRCSRQAGRRSDLRGAASAVGAAHRLDGPATLAVLSSVTALLGHAGQVGRVGSKAN
jgi:hypothetical protein